MTEHRRQMMLRIADGQMEVVEYLYLFSMHVRCDEVLLWLLRNRLTGSEFLAWSRENFGRFRLDVLKHVLMKIDGEMKEVLAGRDLIL